MSFGAQKRNCKVFAAAEKWAVKKEEEGVGRGRWFPAGRSRTRAQSELAFHANRNASLYIGQHGPVFVVNILNKTRWYN